MADNLDTLSKEDRASYEKWKEQQPYTSVTVTRVTSEADRETEQPHYWSKATHQCLCGTWDTEERDGETIYNKDMSDRHIPTGSLKLPVIVSVNGQYVKCFECSQIIKVKEPVSECDHIVGYRNESDEVPDGDDYKYYDHDIIVYLSELDTKADIENFLERKFKCCPLCETSLDWEAIEKKLNLKKDES